jgi:hypothetical protein
MSSIISDERHSDERDLFVLCSKKAWQELENQTSIATLPLKEARGWEMPPAHNFAFSTRHVHDTGAPSLTSIVQNFLTGPPVSLRNNKTGIQCLYREINYNAGSLYPTAAVVWSILLLGNAQSRHHVFYTLTCKELPSPRIASRQYTFGKLFTFSNYVYINGTFNMMIVKLDGILLLPVALRPFQFGLGFLYNWRPLNSVQRCDSPSFDTHIP